MQKILLSKKATIDDIKEEVGIMDLKDVDALTFIIPKDSEFKKNIENFYELKNFINELGKDLAIESVDDEVLELAEEAGIESLHPLFNKRKKMTDLSFSRNYFDDQTKGKKIKSEQEKEVLKEDIYKQAKEDKVKKTKESSKEIVFGGKENHHQNKYFQEYNFEEEIKKGSKKKINFKKYFKKIFWAFLILIILFGTWKFSFLISKVQINMKLVKTPFQFNDTINISKNISSINLNSKTIPAQVFEYESNTTQTFKATSKKYVEEKATGIITIYNNYSSDPQTLVASTRFEAPNGLIYRLKNQIVIPGAQIKDGKIISSSIDAEIIADKPGKEYNSGPISKLTIPGFKGSPKYNGFYGEVKQEVKGGFIGEKLIPQKDDIDLAQQKTKEILISALKNNLTIKQPPEFKFIGDPDINIQRLSVNTTTDDKGNFAVFATGKIKTIGIKEKDIYNFLIQINNTTTLAQKPKKIIDLKLDFSNPQIDFSKGEAKLNLNASGAIVFDLNIDDFKKEIAGKNIKEIISNIKNSNEIVSMQVSLWPPIINKLPQKLDKIKINIEY